MEEEQSINVEQLKEMIRRLQDDVDELNSLLKELLKELNSVKSSNLESNLKINKDIEIIKDSINRIEANNTKVMTALFDAFLKMKNDD